MGIIDLVKDYDASMILIQGMKDEWTTKKRTKASGQVVESPGPSGRRVPSGFGRLDELVFAEIMCRREGSEFYFDFRWEHDPSFGKCRQNAQMCGESIPACTFTELGTFLIDGSEEEQWA